MSEVPWIATRRCGVACAIAGAIVGSSASLAAAPQTFIDPGLYRATRADVVATGRVRCLLTRTKCEFASKGAYPAPVHWAPFVLWGS